MFARKELKDIDVVILCGGLGTRLRSVVDDRPKAMAPIAGRTLLDIIIDYIANFGFERFILCVGYKGDFIKKHLKRNKDTQIVFSEEKSPLGTGGAVKNAKSLIKSSPFLLLNGDSLLKIDLGSFLNFHLDKMATISIALVKVNNTNEYGKVELNRLKQITGFKEKIGRSNSSYINAGIYFCQKEALFLMPKTESFSLERDFFPSIVKKKKMCGYAVPEELVDIGTPERYKYAKVFFETKF